MTTLEKFRHGTGVGALLLALVYLPLADGLDVSRLRVVQVICLLVSVPLLFFYRPSRSSGALLAALTFQVAAAVLSTVSSKDLDASVPLLFGWIWLLVVALIAVHVSTREPAWNLLWGALVAAAAIQSAWSFFVWWGGGFAATSQSGTFFAPNQFAGYLLILGPLPLSAALTVPKRSEAASWGFLTIMIYLAVLLSGSRAGAAAAAAGILAALGLAFRNDVKRAAFRTSLHIVGFLASAAFLSSPLLFPDSPPAKGAVTAVEAKAGTTEGRLVERLHWSQGAILIGATRPLTGTGLGTYGDMLLQVQDPTWSWSKYAHNHYLETFAEGGVLLLAGTVALPLVTLQRLPRRQSTRYWKQSGLWAGLFGGSLHLVFDYDWAFPAYTASFIVSACLLRTEPGDDRVPIRGQNKVGLLLGSLALIVGAAVVLNAVAVSIAGQVGSARNLRLASQLAPYSTLILQARAERLLASGERSGLVGASEILRSAEKIDELDPGLAWSRADISRRLGMFETARSSYRRGITLAPNAPRSYRLAAEFELEFANPLSAAEILDDGIARLLVRPSLPRASPPVAELLLLRSTVEEQIGGPAAAVRFAQEAVELNPRFLLGWLRISGLACDSKNPDLAKRAATQALRLGPSVDLSAIPEECRP